jgi:hypothetical protein
MRCIDASRVSSRFLPPQQSVLIGSAICLYFAMSIAAKPAVADSLRSMSNIEPAITALLASTADNAYLIISVPGTGDFIQLAGYKGSAELDFPQITSRQKQVRPMIENVCSELGLELRTSRGSNGAEFLDYDLPKSPGEISKILRLILMQVYDVSDTTMLELETNGFDLPDVSWSQQSESQRR